MPRPWQWKYHLAFRHVRPVRVHGAEPKARSVGWDEGVTEGEVLVTEADGHLVRKGEGGVGGVQTVNVRLGVVRHVPVNRKYHSSIFISRNWLTLFSNYNFYNCLSELLINKNINLSPVVKVGIEIIHWDPSRLDGHRESCQYRHFY